LTADARLLLLIQGVIRARELWSNLVSKFKKHHPALKHGAYSSTAVLPGEDPAEFERLYQAHIADLAPTGALEEDIVADIARLVWRKQHLGTFSLSKGLRTVWDGIFSEKFHEKFPHAAPDSPRRTLSVSERDKLDEAIGAARDQMREKLGEDAFRLVEMDDTATFERLLTELEIEERLGALIDKCYKRLLFLRGLKSLRTASSSAPPQPIAESRRIPRPTKAA
jgi:hypothetical protein